MESNSKNNPVAKQLAIAFSLFICFLVPKNTFSQNVVVSGAISGNGNYANLQGAFSAINLGVQTGANIMVNIIAGTTETASAVLNSGAWTTLSVTPSGGIPQTVNGNIAAPLVDLNGADNVYINGLNNGGNALTFSNSNTGNVLVTTLRLTGDAVSNTITNCTLLGSATAATLGVITFSTAAGPGNSSNTISNCSIGPAGANLPVNGIYATGSAGFDNINNSVLNCNIFDFYSTSLVSAGILISVNNSGWTISGNRLYQTALRAYGTANTHRGIQIGAGNNHMILNNTIGYSSSTSTGTYSMTSTVATRYIAIDLAVGTLTASSVQGNTVTAITLTTSSSAATTNGILCGINVTTGNVNIGNLSGNLIGGTTGTNFITGVPTTANGMVVGIHSSSTGSIVIQNNYLGGMSSSGLTAAVSGGIGGINISGLATGLIITGNTIGNATIDNMRGGTSGLTTGASPVSGINISAALATTLVTVSSNTIQNLSSYGTATGGYVRGFWTGTSGAAVFLISNNVIASLKSDNANVTISSGLIGTAGIILSSGNTSTVSGNLINGVANANTATTANIAGGIINANGTNTVIRYNRIYNITNQSTSTLVPGVAAGIIIRSGNGNLTIFNNMISLGNGQTSNTSFVGIWGNHGSSPNPNDLIYFNTINIEGAATSGAQPSFGFMRGDFTGTTRTSPVDIRNNLITNTRSGGTGTHCAIGDNYGIPASSSNWGANATNYNVLNANPATVGWWNTAQTFSGWKTVTGCDGNSVSGITVTYANSVNNLHLNMGLAPTYIESGGQTITGITDDIDNQVRPGPAGSVNGGALFPDIGADEIDGVLLTCTVASGGSITPSTFVVCSGQTLAAASVSASSGLGTVYQWQVSTSPGGPYTNVTGGFGSTTTSYTSAPLPQGIYYVVLKTTCTSATLSSFSNQVTLTVNNTPTVSASSTTTFVCSSQSLNLNASPGAGTSYAWNGPNGFFSTSQNTVINNSSINASGNYSFTSSVNNCTSVPAVVSITVNATPTTLTLTPSTALICSGSSQTLGASGGDVPGGVLNFTPQINQNTPTTYPAPYSVYWGGQKMQFLILASELTNAGLVAGPLTSIQFPVISKGVNWGVSMFSCENFRVSLGLTALNSVGATFFNGLTVVGASTNYTPSIGFNLHNFSPTFVWDGTSNVIVETVFSNNLTGAQNDAVISYNSPTTFQSTLVYRADGQTFATIAATTTPNEPTNFVRPDFILKGQTKGTYTWTPPTGLSATTGATVNATPLINTIYTVMVSTGLCSTSIAGSINVTPMPTLSIASTSSAVCAGQAATLMASGAASYSWNTSSTTSSIVVTPGLNTSYTASNQTLPCPVVSASIYIVVNPLPIVNAVSSLTAVCSGGTATLVASGAINYSWSPGSTISTQVVGPTSNSVYTVTGTDALGCSNTATVAVATNSLPVVLVAPAGASVCTLSQASFTASGANTYSWNTGNQTAVLTVTASSNSIYTVTGLSAEGCASSKTVGLAALTLPQLTISPAFPKICKGDLINLSASGANTYTWKPDNTSAAAISVSPGATTNYTVTGTAANSCTNTTAISVLVETCTGITNINEMQNKVLVYPNPSFGFITTKFEFEGEKEILITNSVGASIAKIFTVNHIESIDLSTKAKGIYFVNVKTKTTSSNHRIVIQ